MPAPCSWSASRCCSTGRSVASSGATSRSATRSINCRKRCCLDAFEHDPSENRFPLFGIMRRNQATSNVTSPLSRLAASSGGQGSDVGQDRSERIPDAGEIAAINAPHSADTALKPADLLFVFGTREDDLLRAEKA